MRKLSRARRRFLPVPAVAAVVLTCAGCEPSEKPESDQDVTTRRPIAEVIEEHAPRLMQREDVVGVYEGRTESGETCLKIMVTEESDGLRAAIPATIDGYETVLHPTGPLGPRGH